jgi:16S rRNA C967 or C1407 C5-methylase (RsmB/RsmF family)
MESCAAPGNKTLQLQKYFPKNTIISYEKDKKRFKTLEQRIQKHRGSNDAEYRLLNDNFFYVSKLPEKERLRVKVGICDPSCSGSGMLDNFDSREDANNIDTELE